MTTVYIDGRPWVPPTPDEVRAGFARLADAIRPRLARRTAPTSLAVLHAVGTIATEHRTYRPVASVREVAVRAQIGHDTTARHLRVLCSPEVSALRAVDTAERDIDQRKPGVGRARAYEANRLLMSMSIAPGQSVGRDVDVDGYDHTPTVDDAQKSVVVRVDVTAPAVLRHRTGRGPLHGLVVGALSGRPSTVSEVADLAGCTRETAGKHLRDAETDGTARRVPAGRHDRWVAGDRDLADVRLVEAEAAAQRQAERHRLDRQGFADHRARVLNARARTARSAAA